MKTPRRGHVVAEFDTGRLGTIDEVLPAADPGAKPVVVVAWNDGERQEIGGECFFGSNRVDFWVSTDPKPDPGRPMR